VGGCVTEESSAAVIVIVTATKVLTTPMATDWVFIVAVQVIIKAPTPWFAVLAITVEAVVMFRNVANLIKPVTECRIVITTQIFYTLMVFHVTDVAVLAVLVCIASTKVGTAAMSADWELIRAVLIRAAAIGTLEVVNITEVAVAVVRHVTHHRTVTAGSIVPAALNATIVAIADETNRAVIVNFTTTQVRVAVVTTNGVKLRAVFI